MTDINYMEKLDKLEADIIGFLNQFIENDDYKNAFEKYNFIKDKLNKIIKGIEDVKKDPVKYSPELNYNYYIDQINELKDKIRKSKKDEPEELMKNKLIYLLGFLPKPEEEQPEQPEQPEQQEPETEAKPEQPKIKVSPQLTKGALPVRVAKLNPEEEKGQQEQEETTTPTLNDFTSPKPEEEEEEKEQGQPLQNQQIVPTPEQNYKLMEKEIEEFKKNPQIDIITGVGEVIEYMATSNLTDEMIDKLIDEMLDLKDSHGNLLFNNRFQIEDLVRNRKKRKRLKYLLPKRIIIAEKPDEQKLIINPMLRRGRIASMTSAKERYYNYI